MTKPKRLPIVAQVQEASGFLYRKTPRRFYRLTHDRNKSWYYTCIREQY